MCVGTCAQAFGAGAEAAAESAAAEGVAGASALLALSVDASESHLAAIHDHLVRLFIKGLIYQLSILLYQMLSIHDHLVRLP